MYRVSHRYGRNKSYYPQAVPFRFTQYPANAYPDQWGQIQKAYETGNSRMSMRVHQNIQINKGSAEELHGGDVSEYIQSIVFGGLDGIITTFAILVAAVSTQNLTYGSVLIITVANLLGDAIGMGVGDFISSKAEDDAASAERRREEWEIENMPEDEKREMVDIYIEKGFSPSDSQEIVDLLFQTKPAFLDIMMIEELGLMPEEAGKSAWKGALITFGAFILLGGIPALAYLFSGTYNKAAKFDGVFAAAIILFSVTLFILGAWRGRITGKKWYITGVTMLLNGGITSVLAFIFGYFIK